MRICTLEGYDYSLKAFDITFVILDHGRHFFEIGIASI